MNKKQNIKTPKYQFGTPFEVPRPGGIQARISVDFKKVLSSWFNVSDLLPSRTGIDGETLKNIIPTIFQGHQSESSTKTMKTPPHTYKKSAKRLYIDMNKLEEIKTLDPKEKENLKLILNELKCEHEMENKQTKPDKQAKKRKNKIQIEKKAKSSFPKEKIKNTKCSNTKRKKTTIRVGKLRKSMSKLSQCRECKHCSEVFDKTYKNKKRKQKQPPTTIVSSTEQLLQTLMVDARAYGDIIKQPIKNTEKNSGSSINTIYRKNQNICIKNIELKYLKPTYVVQYNTNDTSLNDDSIDLVYPRERLYSTAALDAHLGQTSAPDYHEGRPHAAKTPMHYQESNLRIIGVGLRTEEMLRERGDSSVQSSLKREDTSEYVPNIKLPIPQTERMIKWPRDPLPSYLLPTEQQSSSIILQTNPVKNRKEPKSRKCMDFVKKCLCLPTGKKDDLKKIHKVPSGMTRIHKDEFMKIGKKSPPNYNNDVIVNRITQDDFFDEDFKTKQKQKLQKKGKVKKVRFNN